MIEDGGTPFVEIDSDVVRYINECGDPCVKEKFTYMTKSEGDTTVIFPHKRFSNLAAANDDLNKIKQNFDIIRSLIHSARNKVKSFAPSSDPKANRKSKYYLRFLDAALEECNQIETELQAPYPSGTFNPEEFPGLFSSK